MFAQHPEHASTLGGGAGAQVVELRVLRGEAQGHLFATASDQDGRMRLLQRLRTVDRALDAVVASRNTTIAL